MNLLQINAGLDFSILKVNLSVSIYFFIEEKPFSSKDPNFLKTVKGSLKKLQYFKVKRYEFKVVGKGKEKKNKYDCDGVIIFRSKDYSKFVYYFYSTTFPHPDENHPIYEFIPTCNVLFVKDYKPKANVIEMMNGPIFFIIQTPAIVSREDGFYSDLAMERHNISKWYSFSDNGDLIQSNYEELFQKFGFETNDII